MHVLVFILSFLSLLCHCSKVMICMYVCYMLFNKYSVLNYLSLLILYLSCRWDWRHCFFACPFLSAWGADSHGALDLKLATVEVRY